MAVVKAKTKAPSEEIQDEALQVEEIDGIDAKLLEDAPALTPYRALRVGRRKVFVQLMKKFQSQAEVEPENAEHTDDDIPLQDLETLYDMLDDMDRALESVAVDPAAYVAWVTDGSTEEKIAALFRTYVTDLGNLTGSAN